MLEQKTYRHKNDYDKKSLLHYIGRRLKWSLGDRSPIVAYLKVTQRCNLDCYYCPWHAPANDYEGELGTDEWKSIILEMVKSGVRVLVFEGGEPTLRRDLPILLEYAHSLDASTILATNATGNPWIFSPTAFTISVDGPEQAHDNARGKGTYKKIIKNLERRGNQRAVSITVISRSNKDLIENICKELGKRLDGLLFTFLYPYKTRATDALCPKEVAEVKKKILSLKSEYRILNPRKYLIAPMSALPCHDWLSVSVNHTGHVEAGCFVQHVEEKDCATCELGCFQVLSAFHQFNLESWFNLHRLLLKTI